MRLERVEISDFRSIFSDEQSDGFRLDLAGGMNTLVGSNNCGKSNVLRAIALALDPNAKYDPQVDNPGPRPFAYPIVALHMRAGKETEEDLASISAARRYEQSLGVSSGFSVDGRIVLRVAYEPSESGYVRRESLVTPDGSIPTQPEQLELLQDALMKVRIAVRFVLVSSGESIRSVLEGNFREILHSVVRDRLAEAFDQAEQSRTEYVAGIEQSLLAPLRERLTDDIGQLFPEIERATLVPEVPTIDQTLSNVRVGLEDLVATPLSEKGTGVRGGVLVAMLSYLANNSNRGMIFALEEPEAFLHPASQEDLRDRLEQIASNTDVTLLVTTHSPFVVANSETGQVVALAKDKAGRTRVSETARGGDDHAPIVAGLMRDSTFASMFNSSSSIPESAGAVVFVEGHGDKFCLELAARVVGRADLLEGIHVVAAGGAIKVVPQAIVARASTDKPVIVLLDHDQAGLHAYKMLTGSTFGFKKGKEAITYAAIFSNQFQNFPVEAEDLFDVSLLEDFVAQQGTDIVDGTKKRPDGVFHYDFGQSAKELLSDHLTNNTKPRHVRLWLELILKIRELAGLPDFESTVEALIQDAPDTDPATSTGDEAVLILTGKLDYARYQTQGVVVLDTSVGLADNVSHIGFYADGEIKPEIPAIQQHYSSIRFDDVVVAQLRATGRQGDSEVASLIAQSLKIDDDLAGTTRQLIRLADPSDPASIAMGAPIANTKESNGRPLAWTIAPRIVRLSSLKGAPATTGELDKAEGAMK